MCAIGYGPRVSVFVLCAAGELEEASRLYHEALALAQAIGDEEAAEQIQEGLKELASRRDAQSNAKPGAEAECPAEGQAASD